MGRYNPLTDFSILLISYNLLSLERKTIIRSAMLYERFSLHGLGCAFLYGK